MLQQFINPAQLSVMREGMKGEESSFFTDKILEYGQRIKNMPVTYEQDGKGDQAIIYLHYFTPSCDWYITEKDSDPDGEGQIQAFGIAVLCDEPEMGYISIKELINNGAELDLHFEPQTIGTLKQVA